MPEVRVQDETGTVHVFPDGSTPEMISNALGLKPPAPTPALNPTGLANQALKGTGITVNAPVNANIQTSNQMTIPSAIKRLATAAGAAGENTINSLGTMMSQMSIIQGLPSVLPEAQGPVDMAKGVSSMVTEPLKRGIVEGDVAGAIGEGAVTVPQAFAAIEGGIKGVKSLPGAFKSEGVKAVPEAGTYSKQGDLVASSLRSNSRVDMPAEAKIAHPLIKEAMANKGYTPDMFEGRNGPAIFKDSVREAVRIAEERASQPINAIAGETVNPEVLAANPDLAARFKPGESVTYGRLNAERIKLNEELTRGNFFTKDPTQQAAAGDALESVHNASNQARDLVYDYAQKRTGYDLAPLKRAESSLLKLTDSANVTANTLSAKEAQFNATPIREKVAQSAKNLIAVKNNPMSAFFSYEKPGLVSPTKRFNTNMQKAFADVNPSPADTSVQLQNNKVPTYLEKRFGLDQNFKPNGPIGYPDTVKPAARKNAFGLDTRTGGIQAAYPDVKPSGALEKYLKQKKSGG